MTNFIEEIQYNSVSDFLKEISYGGNIYNQLSGGKNFVFRGHGSEKYELVPSILRNKVNILDRVTFNEQNEFKQIQIEYNLISSFFMVCDRLGLYVPNAVKLKKSFSNLLNISYLTWPKWIPDDLYELAALAQHYGIPTRLLDWTHDINVALYFAIRDNLKKLDSPVKIVIWAIDLFAIQEKIQNGLVGSISNIEYGPLKIIQPPYHFNPYLAAQKGLFTHWQKQYAQIQKGVPFYVPNEKVDRRPLDKLIEEYINTQKIEIGDKKLMYKYIITIDKVTEAYSYLKMHGFDASAFFPGYAGVAKSCSETFIANVLEGKIKREI